MECLLGEDLVEMCQRSSLIWGCRGTMESSCSIWPLLAFLSIVFSVPPLPPVCKNGPDYANAGTLTHLPFPESIPIAPQPTEAVLLNEQMQEGPITTDHIKTWTPRDPVLSCVLQFVQHEWFSSFFYKQLQPFLQKRS